MSDATRQATQDRAAPSDDARHAAFHFDATACSGCKCCQIACRDRNNLPVGIHWRQIHEITGGGWEQRGAAWHPSVMAFSLSMACNHCEKPICLEVCPAGAITSRADGLVHLDGERCLGCGYCSWACPYGAPQYDQSTGRMGKCNYCVEDHDSGGAPACVATCPARALDSGELQDLEQRHGGDPVGRAPFPLPEAELTHPSLILTEHRDSGSGRERELEADPGSPRELREWSLVFFTLLSQMAAGMAMVLGALRLWSITAGGAPMVDGESATGWFQLTMVSHAAMVILMVLAMVISLLHLGSPRNLWRALINLRGSWLSREILLAGLFLGLALVGMVPLPPGGATVTHILITALAAAALVYGMTRVYMLRTVPVWNHRFTPLNFFGTSLLMGSLTIFALNRTLLQIGINGDASAIDITPERGLPLTALIVLIILWIGIRQRNRGRTAARMSGQLTATLAVVLLAVIVMWADLPATSSLRTTAIWLAWILAFISEIRQRSLFYRSYWRRGI